MSLVLSNSGVEDHALMASGKEVLITNDKQFSWTRNKQPLLSSHGHFKDPLFML